MASARDLFHKISYAQYPLMAVGLLYAIKPLLNELVTIWSDYNMALVFYGLSLSMATLQDTTKSQNKMSQRIWENPRKSKLLLLYIAGMAGIFLLVGVTGAVQGQFRIWNELSFGLISLGVGFLGILKSGMEMAENHQAKLRPTDPT